MNNSTFEKFKVYLVPILSIVVVVVLVPTVVLPQFSKIRENLSVVNQNSDRLDDLESKADALEELAKAEAALDKNLAIAESALPIEKDVARLVRGVQGLAVETGLEVSKVEIKPGKTATVAADTAAAPTTQASTAKPLATAETSKSELIFGLSLRGNLASFQNFLKSVESTKRLLILSSFKSTSTSGVDYSYNVVINAPFGPLPKISQDQLAKAIVQLSANNQKLLNDLETDVFKNVTNVPLPTGPRGTQDPFK